MSSSNSKSLSPTNDRPQKRLKVDQQQNLPTQSSSTSVLMSNSQSNDRSLPQHSRYSNKSAMFLGHLHTVMTSLSASPSPIPLAPAIKAGKLPSNVSLPPWSFDPWEGPQKVRIFF